MTEVQFEAAVTAEGFDKPVQVQRAPGYRLEVHSHPFDARALITEGAITLVVAGVPRTYQPGEIFDLPAGTPHEESAGPQGVCYLSGRRQVVA